MADIEMIENSQQLSNDLAFLSNDRDVLLDAIAVMQKHDIYDPRGVIMPCIGLIKNKMRDIIDKMDS